MTDTPLYQAGRHGVRMNSKHGLTILSRASAEAILDRIEHTIATSGSAELVAFNRQCREELVAAMAASFTQHRSAAE